jgi:hypothetical protein
MSKQKKPGFSDHLYVLTDILAKTRFLTRARFGDESFLGMGSRIVFSVVVNNEMPLPLLFC